MFTGMKPYNNLSTEEENAYNWSLAKVSNFTTSDTNRFGESTLHNIAKYLPNYLLWDENEPEHDFDNGNLPQVGLGEVARRRLG